MMKQQLKKLMFLILLGMATRQASCADQPTVSPVGKTLSFVGNTVAWTGAQANAVKNSSFGWRLFSACEAIAAYTIFEKIKKVGLRSTATLLTSKPLVFPMACYLLAPLVSHVFSWWREKVENSSFDSKAELNSLERCKERDAFYESKLRKEKVLDTCKHYVDMLPLASVLCFLTLVQPLSVSVASKVLC